MRYLSELRSQLERSGRCSFVEKEVTSLDEALGAFLGDEKARWPTASHARCW